MSKTIHLPKSIAKPLNKAIFGLKRCAPDILVVIGVGMVIGATVTAVKKGAEGKDILEKHNEKREKIGERTKENAKEVASLYKDTAVNLTKTYGKEVAVMGAGIGMIFYSHHILKQRNAALLAAYTALNESFNKYRNRVMSEKDIPESEGAGKRPKETHFVNGIEVDENGLPVGAVCTDPNAISPYAFIFGPSSPLWRNHPETNYQQLRNIQECVQKNYDTKGYLLWNDVLDAFGEDRTSAGAVMGWKKGFSEDYIDLGVLCPDEIDLVDWLLKFERPFIVSPNLTDVIWDKI